MNIEYLREFTTAAMTLNLSQAAKELHLSQPSLSKHIASLEKECGSQLFKRSASRVQLTPAGMLLFEEASKLLRFHDETLAKIRQISSIETIRIGGLYRSNRVIALANSALAALTASGTAASLNYQDHRSQPYDQLLQEDRIDVAISILGPGEVAPAGLEAKFLFDDPMVCLAKKAHPFYERESLKVSDLSGQSILQPVGSYSTDHGRSTVKTLLEKHNAMPFQLPVFLHSISELSTVPNDTCLLIMERSMAQSQPFGDEYRIIPFEEDDAVFSFYALTRKNEQRPSVKSFLNLLTTEA
ncbi:MAG: LysR family transcriptional regulator [Eggerthellaceae bacterium]|nr:LysR family transcriptional regulator [Eggerthellaceae bacterium]